MNKNNTKYHYINGDTFMFIKYLSTKENIYLYTKNRNYTYPSITNYLNNNNINYNNKDIYIVINDIIVNKINNKLLIKKVYKNNKFINNKSKQIINNYKLNIYILIKIINRYNIIKDIKLLKKLIILTRTKLLHKDIKINEIETLIYLNTDKNYIKLINKIIRETNNKTIKYKKTKNNIRFRIISNNYLEKVLNENININTNIKIDNKYIYINNKKIENLKLYKQLNLDNYICDIKIKNKYTYFITKDLVKIS